MGQGVLSFDNDVRALMSGLLVGDLIFVNGTSGDDNSNGLDFSHSLKHLKTAVTRTTSNHCDYILCTGAETGTAAIEIAQARLHIIGVGSGGPANEAARGFVYTAPVTVDTLQPTTAADYLEIAGIMWMSPATDAILIDDAGADGCFFHHNTVYGSTTASVAIRLDIEGAYWSICDNHMVICKLPIDVAGAFNVIRRNVLTSVAASAKGVVVGASSHYTIVDGNIINMIVGTGEVGITIASHADSCVVSNNIIGAADPISDSGTSTLLVNNWNNAFISGSNTYFFKGVIT